METPQPLIPTPSNARFIEDPKRFRRVFIKANLFVFIYSFVSFLLCIPYTPICLAKIHPVMLIAKFFDPNFNSVGEVSLLELLIIFNLLVALLFSFLLAGSKNVKRICKVIFVLSLVALFVAIPKFESYRKHGDNCSIKSEHRRIECYKSQAVEKLDVSICDKIVDGRPSFQTYRSECIGNIASDTNNLALCESDDVVWPDYDTYSDYAASCYKSASSKITLEYCNQLSKQSLKDACYFTFVYETYDFVNHPPRDESVCDLISIEQAQQKCHERYQERTPDWERWDREEAYRESLYSD